jgi:peptidoglycan/xylan/chitin deacetylase (PgdA/CDA1 family)
VRRSIRGVGRAFGALARTNGLVILAYHRIDDGGGGLAISPSSFLQHLAWIEESGLSVEGSLGPPYPARGAGPRLALTFDDGYRSVAEVAWPELRSRGWPATLYVVARALDDPRPFAWDAGVDDSRARLIDRSLLLDLAADGMSIGSHTCSHRYLPALSHANIRTEIADSRRILEDILGQEVRSLSYPMGGWNRSIRDLTAAAGYTTAVTSDRGSNLRGRDPLSLRRQPAEEDPVLLDGLVRGSYDFLRPIDRFRRPSGRSILRHAEERS